MSIDLGTLVDRVWARDHTVWKPDPTEIANRLGWLDVMTAMRARVGQLRTLADDARDHGVSTAVLLGMGGSSLAPEVMRTVLGAQGLDLHVMDTTHPSAVRRLKASLDLARTLFIVASKSGTTTETLSHLATFSAVAPPDRFVAITDPGTPLEQRARTENFRAVFANPPDIGGRYSALSLFGLVPAALIGADLDRLLDSADEMASRCRATSIGMNPGAALGVALGEACLLGRDKLTTVMPGPMAALGPWIEQLIAESTGKEGTGIVPVVDEPHAGERGGDDRLFVSYGEQPSPGDPAVALPQARAEDLGGEFFRWEFATAIAGAVLGINPFDQPNVEEAKAATKRILDEPVAVGDDLPDARAVLDTVKPGDYIAIQAFVDPTDQNQAALEALRARLLDEHGAATTLGFGPRFLHSTGQLHKGGPDSVVCLQIVDEPDVDEPIPGAPYSFGELIRAQADGDLLALKERGRRIARAMLGEV